MKVITHSLKSQTVAKISKQDPKISIFGNIRIGLCVSSLFLQNLITPIIGILHDDVARLDDKCQLARCRV